MSFAWLVFSFSNKKVARRARSALQATFLLSYASQRAISLIIHELQRQKDAKFFTFFHFSWHLEAGIATILFRISRRTIPLKISRHENQGNWPKFFRKRTPGANIPESPYDIILHCFFLIWTYLSEKKTDTHVLRIPPIIPTLLPTPRKHPNSAKLTTEAWKCSINHHNPNSAKLTTEAWKCSFNHHKTSKLSKTDDRSMKMLI